MKQNAETWMWKYDTFDNNADEVIDNDTSFNVVYDNDRLTC